MASILSCEEASLKRNSKMCWTVKNHWTRCMYVVDMRMCLAVFQLQEGQLSRASCGAVTSMSSHRLFPAQTCVQQGHEGRLLWWSPLAQKTSQDVAEPFLDYGQSRKLPSKLPFFCPSLKVKFAIQFDSSSSLFPKNSCIVNPIWVSASWRTRPGFPQDLFEEQHRLCFLQYLCDCKDSGPIFICLTAESV